MVGIPKKYVNYIYYIVNSLEQEDFIVAIVITGGTGFIGSAPSILGGSPADSLRYVSKPSSGLSTNACVSLWM